MNIRPAETKDTRTIAALRGALWPEAEGEELRAEVQALVAGRPRSTLPLAIFCAEAAPGELVGFIEVGLRSHAEGCDPVTPVAYVEGWYVQPAFRDGGVGRALMQAAEAWAREQGARELASDTELDNEDSQHAHVALGFEESCRVACFRKTL